jgi:TP901-1 family phage major tail protein
MAAPNRSAEAGINTHPPPNQETNNMVAQKGKDLLLKIDSEGGFVTVAGLRSKRIAFNSETVNITDADSAGRWRELLAGSGVQRAAVSGSGIFKDQQSDALIRTKFFAGQIADWQFVVPDFGTVEGAFQITSLEYTRSHDGEVTFEIALESAGAVDFTVAA